MIPRHRIPTHPGEILLEDFLRPLGVTQVEFAAYIGDHAPKISDIIHGRRGVSPSMAWKFARALGTSPEFWLNLQAGYDLAIAKKTAPSLKPIRKAS